MELLAKVKEPDRKLLSHLTFTYRAAVALMQKTAEDQIAALGLPRHYVEKLTRLVCIAAVLHDIGKASSHFQQAIRLAAENSHKIFRQGIRHEWIGMLRLLRDDFKHWFSSSLSDIEWSMVLWMINGHHRKNREVRTGCGSEISILADEPDFLAILHFIRDTFGLAEPPSSLTEKITWSLDDKTVAVLDEWENEACDLFDSLSDDERRFLAIAKSSLIAADVAASSFPTEEVEFILKKSFEKPTRDEMLAIVRKRLGGRPKRYFQTKTGKSKTRVTLLLAGCGGGKTVAAYLWIGSHENRKPFICYPTTGTTTEGFRDYLLDLDDEIVELGRSKVYKSADLIHCRSDVDWDLLLDPKHDLDDSPEDKNEWITRRQSLQTWVSKKTCCTVDTVLGLLENNKNGVYAWPAMSSACFVFDEIHSYDDKMFARLLEFIRVFRGLPILLMTATLPKHRLDAINDVLMSLGEPKVQPIRGPREMENCPRYEYGGIIDDPLAVAQKCLSEGKRVLWICNTVVRATEAYTVARLMGLHPILFHSRYKYGDRLQHHNAIIQAFKHDVPALAICTQVAEMSLDISADVLISDICPACFLIQRLGRLNRWFPPKCPTPFYLVEPLRDDKIDYRPYSKAGFEQTFKWLDALPKRALSQRDLAEAWGSVQTVEDVWYKPGGWYAGGWITTVQPVRDATPGYSVILAEDLPLVTQHKVRIEKVAVQMMKPKDPEFDNWPRYHGFIIAGPDKIMYDSEIGGRWL
jgi:CRISPR-associated endonuclease/helicase Cas3